MGNWRGQRDPGGVHITGSGNQINTGRVGRDQRQVHIGDTSPDTAQHLATAQATLAELTAALNEHTAELSNPDLARRTATRIGEELDSTNPDHRRLTENLDDLGLAVGAVASVVTIVQALSTAVAALHG